MDKKRVDKVCSIYWKKSMENEQRPTKLIVGWVQTDGKVHIYQKLSSMQIKAPAFSPTIQNNLRNFDEIIWRNW